jgi:NADH dehydrogenase
VVVNLVGILAEGGRQRFGAVHSAGAEAVAKAAARHGARMVHVSALGANERSSSQYACSKAEGERRVIENVPGAVVFRPSIMFGPEDTFFNRFAGMARLSPMLPLLGGGLSRFQPAFVGDVASAVAAAADGHAKPGTVYELGGPEIFTFKELMQFTLRTIGRRRILLPIPFPLARPLATIAQFVPGAPLTPDQVEMLRADNVVSSAAMSEGRTFEAFGIKPDSIAAIVPSYLWRFRKTGQFTSRHA